MTNGVDMMRSYGVRATIAFELLECETDFAHAVRYFGGLRCWYSQQRARWTLDQKVTTKAEIVYHWERRAEPTSVRR